jgi:predicted dehydrogenase
VAVGSLAAASSRSVGAVSKERIKIGQIGVGHAHASGKMRAFRDSGEFEVVGLVESDPELRRRAERSSTYQGLPLLTREQLLNTPGLKAVAIETRVKDSLDNAAVAIDAGMHIHLDKPAGSSLPKFRSILASATKRKLVVQMGYMYRYNPAVVLLREALKKGWLGEPFEVHAVMSKVVGAGSRKQLAEYPGGIFFELACHILDLVVGVLGRPKSVTGYNQHVSAHEDALVDNMLAVLEYPKAIATVKSAAQEVEGFARRHLVVCGTEGTMHIQPLDNPSARLALSKDRDPYRRGYQDVKFPRYVRYVDDAADLARVIRGEKQHDFPPEHDDAVQESLLKACGLPLDR